jgi:HTH-type transcriptional regulator / antitoxin HigA
MDSPQETLFEPVEVEHPGETVLEYLEFYEWSQRELARRTGLTPKTISEICNGKAPITPTTALALEKVFRRPAHFWLNLQRHFDEAAARRRERAKATDWNQWARHFPLKEMKRLNFSLPEGRTEADVLLSFFGVSSPDSWKSVWTAAGVAYRQTRKFKTREESIAAWVRETELVARELEVAQFDERRLVGLIGDLRRLTRRRVDEVMEPVQQICASAGVAVVLVPELRNTGISGCARWLSEKRALVGLTLRYKTDDQLWFTFFHEIAHLLLHRHKRAFVLDNAAEDLSDRVVDPEMQQLEMEANQFSADTLIPPRVLADFVRRGTFTNESIHDFAESLEVGPGIVVGRLQFDGILARHQGNALKQKLGWQLAEEEG